MKPKLPHRYVLIFLCLIGLNISLKAQTGNPTMDAEWTIKTNDGTHLVLELGIKTGTTHEHLGPAQFIFLFNDSFVHFAGGDTNAINGTDYNWIDSFRPSLYAGDTFGYPASSNVTQPTPGEVIITLNFNGAPGASISSSSSYIPVIDIIFSISDPSKHTSIKWQMNESSPPTFDAVEDDGYGNIDEGSFSGIPINTLPVTLIHFNAGIKNALTSILWTTASEINNDYFMVERSADGKNFNSIAWVQGAGNSESIKEYSAIDPDPLPGISYYRLRQTDYNGDFQIFYIVAVNNKQGINTGIKNLNTSISGPYPEITYSTNTQSDVRFRITDVNGKLILNQPVPSYPGMNKIDLRNIPTLKPGMYFISLYSDEDAVYTKMIVP